MQLLRLDAGLGLPSPNTSNEGRGSYWSLQSFGASGVWVSSVVASLGFRGKKALEDRVSSGRDRGDKDKCQKTHLTPGPLPGVKAESREQWRAVLVR